MIATLFGPPAADAVISSCGRYRYSLTRAWNEALPRIVWVMLNPSTADADRDDNTAKKCKLFSTLWRFGSMEVVNLFALRSTSPRALYVAQDPIGPENDRYIAAAVARASRVIVAWGAHGALHDRGGEVAQQIGACSCLSLTKGGHPGHPLYLPLNTQPTPYLKEAIIG